MCNGQPNTGWLQRVYTSKEESVSQRRPGFAPGSVHVGFVVDKVALGQGFLGVLQFAPVRIIPPWLHTHVSPGG
jgi:hypothetical protein